MRLVWARFLTTHPSSRSFHTVFFRLGFNCPHSVFTSFSRLLSCCCKLHCRTWLACCSYQLHQQHMEGYVRFSSTSPPANPSNGSSQRRFSFQEAPSVDSTDSPYSPDSPHQTAPNQGGTGVWGRSMCPGSWSWLSPPPLQQLFQRWRTPSPRTAFQSNYMTLVPLSGVQLALLVVPANIL
jgi:hypothetical protein